MTSLGLAAVALVLAASMVRALVVQARIAPPFCSRCGEKLERRRLGEQICNCRH
jgi:hypothetical protein